MMDHQNRIEPDYIQEWKKRDELSKWKAMALSLVFENKMLRSHVKELHVTIMEQEKAKNLSNNQYNNVEIAENLSKKSHPNRDFQKNENPTTSEVKQRNVTNYDGPSRKRGYEYNHPVSVPSAEKAKDDVNQPLNLCRSDRPKMLKEMYGTEANRIAGVETALQLNYEHALSKLHAKYWPDLQLNLGK